jgi:hypothetical protein
MLSMHRGTALANEIRGLLLEFGIVIPQVINKIMDRLAEVLDSNQLSGISYQTFSDPWEEFIINNN